MFCLGLNEQKSFLAVLSPEDGKSRAFTLLLFINQSLKGLNRPATMPYFIKKADPASPSQGTLAICPVS
jgi:hypothetical protein